MPVKETFEEENGTALDVVHSRPGAELLDLVQGRVEAIVAVRSLPDLLQDAAREGVAIDPAGLHQREIGKSDTVIFLHRHNRVGKLSKKQLKAIFTGKITRWKQVGGADRKIVIIWNAAAAENDVFIKEILDGASVVSSTVPVGSYDEMRARVIATPGSIGIAPRGFVAHGIKVPKAPAVASPVVVVTKGEPSALVKKLLDLLKEMEYIP
jgi:phosphate transport system substrate-binding protein